MRNEKLEIELLCRKELNLRSKLYFCEANILDGATSLPAEGGGPSSTVEGECGTFNFDVFFEYAFSLTRHPSGAPSRKEPSSHHLPKVNLPAEGGGLQSIHTPMRCNLRIERKKAPLFRATRFYVIEVIPRNRRLY